MLTQFPIELGLKGCHNYDVRNVLMLCNKGYWRKVKRVWLIYCCMIQLMHDGEAEQISGTGSVRRSTGSHCKCLNAHISAISSNSCYDSVQWVTLVVANRGENCACKRWPKFFGSSACSHNSLFWNPPAYSNNRHSVFLEIPVKNCIVGMFVIFQLLIR